MVIKGTVHLPEKQPLKKMDPLPKNAKNLVIVESPAKAKTIERFLGSDYKVMASRGHLRDLPRNQFGVNIEDNFTPTYTNMFDKRKLIEACRMNTSAPKPFIWQLTRTEKGRLFPGIWLTCSIWTPRLRVVSCSMKSPRKLFWQEWNILSPST